MVESSSNCLDSNRVEPPSELGNYFVSTYPPFSCWTAEAVPQIREVLAGLEPSPEAESWGMYVHIPFCAQRCDFCYYRSFAHAGRPEMADYVRHLLAEAALVANLPVLANRPLGFVYFGGGTPSLLPPSETQMLFEGLQKLFPWGPLREVTFEVAPRTATAGKLAYLKQQGVSRISMGVQQLNDEILKRNGRIHSVTDVLRAYDEIHKMDFAVVNLDLIVGLVGETEESFFRSLENVIHLAPTSITIYQLEIPANTPLHRAISQGSCSGELPSWEVKHQRLDRAFRQLEQSGYSLRTAYAATRNPSSDVFCYQSEQYRGVDLYGLGLASFSYLQGAHLQNEAGRERYGESLHQGRLPWARGYLLDPVERCLRSFILQFKLGRVDCAALDRRFGIDPRTLCGAALERLVERGWLVCDGDMIRVTRPGLLQIDAWLNQFYLRPHQGVAYW